MAVDINDAIYANVGAFKPETRDGAGRQTSGGLQSPSRAAAMCLGLLSLLLLAGIIGLSVYYIRVSGHHHSEMQNIQVSYKNLTAAQTQLQTNCSILTQERDQFRTSYETLTKERDTLTQERDQLQTSYETLTKERDTLTQERDQLQTCYETLIKERNCSQGWKKFGCSCYYISSEGTTWQESSKDCASMYAHLVIINSREEQAFLDGLAVRAWIGLSDLENEGKWKWVDGNDLVGKGFWQDGEPNSKSQPQGENCVELIGGQDGWNDMVCSWKQKYICER